MTAEAACPCGSGAAEAACCAPILAGAPAATALALMRSRYTAYVRGAIDYLIASHAPETRGSIDRDALIAWTRETAWRGLEIVDHDDDHVTFIARGVTRGRPFAQRERSRFRRDGDGWLYVDAVAETTRRDAAPGRNEPCPCGSGKKFKRCHGA